MSKSTSGLNELNQFVRALSEDMNTNLEMLERSFHQLKKQVTRSTLPGLGEGTERVESCLHQSKQLVDKLIALATTDSIHIEADVVQLSPLIEGVVFEQEVLISNRNIEVRIENDLPATRCNQRLLKQILANLIHNAALHGCDPLRPQITIELEDAACDPDNIVLAIHDNGPGIPVESREDIFLPTVRLQTTHTNGMGMGLAIVRKIIDHIGGYVRVDNSTTLGTKFHIQLPRAK